MMKPTVDGDLEYVAFISYNHAADERMATSLRYALQRLGKP